MTAKVQGRRRGAPKKSPDQSRTQVVTVRLTPAEFERLSAEAAMAGRSRGLGRYLHNRAMSRSPRIQIMPAVNQAAWSHLGRWAGAFSTIANAAAGERLAQLYPHLAPSLEVLLERATAELRALRLALLGLDDESMAAAEAAERLGLLSDVEDEEFGEEDDPDEIDPDAPMRWSEP